MHSTGIAWLLPERVTMKDDATGLVPWSLTFPATPNDALRLSEMPRACPVELSRSLLLQTPALEFCRCHGLAPWSLTFAATTNDGLRFSGCHGLVPWSLTLTTQSRFFFQLSMYLRTCELVKSPKLPMYAVGCQSLSRPARTNSFVRICCAEFMNARTICDGAADG